MPKGLINGVELYWVLSGTSGPTLVLVHGAWVGHGTWQALVPHLKDHFRVLIYDRRGHGQSARPAGQGSIRDDVSDLTALIAHLGLAPAHVLGNSYGGMVALRLAAVQPELVESLIVHEPPFLELNDATIADAHVVAMARLQEEAVRLMEAGHPETGIGLFMEAALRPGIWAGFPEDIRQSLAANAPSFVDDINDTEPWTVDLDKLAAFSRPILLTQGEHSPSFYRVILDQLHEALPSVQRQTIPGADHVPHVSHPQEYAELVRAFISHERPTVKNPS